MRDGTNGNSIKTGWAQTNSATRRDLPRDCKTARSSYYLDRIWGTNPGRRPQLSPTEYQPVAAIVRAVSALVVGCATLAPSYKPRDHTGTAGLGTQSGRMT